MALNGTTLLVYDTTLELNPLEIGFRPHYGRIVNYEQVDDGTLLVSFSEGYVVTVSKKYDSIGQELQNQRYFNTSLDLATYNDSLGKVAVAGESNVKVFTLSTFKESKSEKIELPFDAGRVIYMHWTSDGQILSLLTAAGHLYNYLMVVPSLSDAFNTTVCILTSLSEATIIET